MIQTAKLPNSYATSQEDTTLKNNSHHRPSLENQRLKFAPSMVARVVEEALYSPSERSTASGSPLRAREPLV